MGKYKYDKQLRPMEKGGEFTTYKHQVTYKQHSLILQLPSHIMGIFKK